MDRLRIPANRAISLGRQILAGMARYEYLAAMILLTPVITRILLLAERRADLRGYDLRGFLSDLAVGLGVMFVVTLVSRCSRIAATVLTLLWVLWCFGIYEYIWAMGTIPRIAHFGYLADRTFFFGSVLHLRHPMLLLVWFILCGTAAYRLTLDRDWKRRLIPGAIALVGLVIAVTFFPKSNRFMQWRQHNTMEIIIPELWTGSIPRTDHAISTSAFSVEVSDADRERAASVLAADLAAEPYPSSGRTRDNVLLIILEGVSGAYVAPIAEHAGLESSVRLPFLGALCEEALVYPNFVLHQTLTSRGTYALLAGDLPKLVEATPKMTEVASAEYAGRDFLPAVLKRNGYQTIYIQAAPLPFMMKDRFMPTVGFDQVVGARSFGWAYEKSSWGPDDKAFFEQSLDLLVEVNRGDRPWFATMLTVGTHHPYVVPSDYQPPTDQADERERAFYYLDAALELFFTLARARGLLEKTLVILTSDETRGLVRHTDAVIAQLSSQWGLALAITPEGHHAVVDTVYGQSDVALSILDYLGLYDPATDFKGRSLFRAYDTGRFVPFGHTGHGHVGIFDARGDVHLYDARLEPRLHAVSKSTSIFNVEPSAEQPRHRSLVASLVRSSLADAAGSARTNELQLVSKPDFALIGSDLDRYVFGHQYLGFEGDVVLDIDIRVTVLGEDENRVQLTYRFLLGYGEVPYKVRSPWLGLGESHRLHLLCRTGGPVKRVSLQLYALRDNDTDALLHFDQAVIDVVPFENWDGPSIWPREQRAID